MSILSDDLVRCWRDRAWDTLDDATYLADGGRTEGWVGADMTNKHRLHTLVDELPDDAVQAVELFMEFAVIRSRASGLDPMLRAFLSVPQDDEILTAEEMAAIEEGRADVARGDVVSWNEYRDRQRADA